MGGNLCAALPSGPMISLAVALRGTCRISDTGGRERTVPAAEFVTGPGTTVLQPGELLRSITLPAAALTRRSALRRVSTHPWGRSVALVTGTRDPVTGRLTIAVTAATTRPLSIAFIHVPTACELRQALHERLTPGLLFEDPHGHADWRRHLALHLAGEVRGALARER